MELFEHFDLLGSFTVIYGCDMCSTVIVGELPEFDVRVVDIGGPSEFGGYGSS
jgi:hypothetical protein